MGAKDHITTCGHTREVRIGPLALPADTYSVEITDKDDKKTVLLGSNAMRVFLALSYIPVIAKLEGTPRLIAIWNRWCGKGSSVRIYTIVYM